MKSALDQVAALALLAQRLDRTPVFFLDDGEDEYDRVLAEQSDANGDVSRRPVTTLRVAPGAREGPAAPDAVVERVLRVPADLVR